MKKNYLILPLLTISLGACSYFNPEQTDPVDPPVVEEGHLDDLIHESLSKSKTVFSEFFKYENKIEIELTFSEQVMYKLQDYGSDSKLDKNDMYHPCTAKFTINGVSNTYYEVGARIRGNTSRVTDFFQNGKFVEGKIAHFKLSFSQTFDSKEDNDYYVIPWEDSLKREDRKDRKFGGMKKIDLKWNRNFDNTFTKEIYTLDAFRQEKIMAQNSNLVNLTVKVGNESRTMVYEALEAVDKRLLKRYDSDDNSGDLYKCLYTNLGKATLKDYSNNKLGIERPGYRPVYGLKTNEETSDMSVFKTFVDHVKVTNTSGEDFYNDISNYMDVDYFLKFSALCWVFGLPDDFRNNYNNYYIYFRSDNKAIFLPYDNDRCLGIRNNWNIDLKNAKYDHELAYGANERNDSPLVRRFLSDISKNTNPVHQESLTKFHDYCVEYANKYLVKEKFNEFTSKFFYAPSKDITKAGEDNDTFEVYATAKLATL